MLLCAVVGLVLVVSGAWALPRPAALGSAQHPAAGTTVAAPSASSRAASRTSTARSTAPSATSAPTTKAAPSTKAVPSGRTTGASTPAEPTRVPSSGPGTYDRANVSVASTTDKGRLYRFDVRVEKGLDLDADTVGRALEKTLDDPRSWRSTGRVRFSLVKAGDHADLHAYLVTPGTTDRLCAPLLTGGEVSCRAGDKVVLNAKRWVLGSKAFGPDVAEYREYLANHEFGHALGHGHVGCPRQGRPAPVMLQQTKGLQGCTANPWPSVSGG